MAASAATRPPFGHSCDRRVSRKLPSIRPYHSAVWTRSSDRGRGDIAGASTAMMMVMVMVMVSPARRAAPTASTISGCSGQKCWWVSMCADSIDSIDDFPASLLVEDDPDLAEYPSHQAPQAGQQCPRQQGADDPIFHRLPNRRRLIIVPSCHSVTVNDLSVCRKAESTGAASPPDTTAARRLSSPPSLSPPPSSSGSDQRILNLALRELPHDKYDKIYPI